MGEESERAAVPPDVADRPLDPAFVAAVEEAVIGDMLADLPEAQPDRELTSATDVSSLYVRHRNGLAAHARRFLRDSRDVDEVVQETFLRLFLAIDEIDTELQAIAFARRTLTNLCIDRYRADRRRPALVHLDMAPVGDLSVEDEGDDAVLRAEDAAIVREALAQLSPLHRAALVKREIEEKPLPQIAAELEIPEDSVKHVLFRARRALRRLLVGTSVEPGVDLTATEFVAIANRRAGAAMMRGANALIVLVVGALVAAVGVGALEGRDNGLTNGLSAPQQSAPPSADQATRPLRTHRGGAGGRNTASSSVTHHVAVSPPAAPPTLPTVSPVQHAPIKAPFSGVDTGASRSHFKLSGPLQVTGTPQVVAPMTTDSDGGAVTTSASSFVAPTSQGTFQLAQTVTDSAAQGANVLVTPSFVVGNVVETPTLTGSTSSVSTAPDGTVAVSAVATAQPDTSTNAFPLTSMVVHLVLTPDLSRVLSETVVLTALPPTSTVPTGTTPTVPTGTSPSDGDAPAGTGTAAPTTDPAS